MKRPFDIDPLDWEAFGRLLIPAPVHAFAAARPLRQAMLQTRTQARERAAIWLSAVTGKEHDAEHDASVVALAPHGPLALGLALWSQGLHEGEAEAARLVAIADPLASLLTLVFEAKRCTCAGTFLESLFHRYYRETRCYEDCLAQRPALQLVLVGRDPGQLSDLRQALQGTLRRTGEAAVDLQVRWLRDPDDDTKLLPQVLAGHCPLPVGAPGERAVKLPDRQELTSAVAGTQALIDRLPDPASGRQGVWELCQTLQDSGPVLPQPPPTERENRTLSSRPASLLAARLAIRRFQSRPLTLPLAPVTFLMSQNASGKTTLIEGLSELYLGMPRPRLIPPEGSDRWRDQECDQGREAEQPPELEGLGLVQTDVGEPADLDPAAVLPLFGDDARLDAGTLGETTLLGILPLRFSDRAAQEVGSWRAELPQLVRVLRDLSERIERWADLAMQGGKGNASKPAAVELGRELQRRFRAYLSDAVLRLESDTDKASLASGVTEEERTNEERRMQEVQALIAAMGRAPVHCRVPSELVVQHLADFLSWDLAQGRTPLWDDLGRLDQSLGGSEALGRLAADTLLGRVARFEREADGYWQAFAREALRATQTEALEATLADYFEVGLARDRAQVRPNTARQVRNGQVARLARWLGVGGIDLPVLLLDEPLLGQDLPASAALLGRYLRLRRRTEALRWAQASTEVDDTDTPLLAPKLVYHRCQPPNGAIPQAEEGARRAVWPLPPQVVATSNKPAALAAAAESEGAVLDGEVRRALEGLIPPEWQGDVLSALRSVQRRLRAALSQFGTELSPTKPPAQALRLYWEPPQELAPVAEPKEYLEAVSKSLKRLGLGGLALEVESLRGGTDGKGSDPLVASTARRLLHWLVLTDLLPAVARDSGDAFAVSGVTTRALPAAGGPVQEMGPARLRRIGIWLQSLPPDPGGGTSVPEVPTEPATVSRDAAATPPATAAPIGVWSVALPGNDSDEEIARKLRERIEAAVREAGMRVQGEGDPPPTLSLRLAPDRDGSPRRIELCGPAERAVRDIALASLGEELVKERVAALLAVLPEGQPVGVGLVTHEEKRDLGPDVAFTLGGGQVPVEGDAWQIRTRGLWESGVTAPLALLRRVLALDMRTQSVRFYPRCHLGAAIRAGAVFSHTSGFHVECLQGEEPWDLTRQPTFARPPIDIKLDRLPDRPEEVHLLLSLSQAVEGAYRRWVEVSRGPGPVRVLHIAPTAGPSRDAITREAVVDWGEAVFQALASARSGVSGPTRIFCAAPVALAMAIGRSLNACGRIIIMDMAKPTTGGYFESFDFET